MTRKLSYKSLFQNDFDQTGIALLENGERIPLYSSNPTTEAASIAQKMHSEIKNVFVTSTYTDGLGNIVEMIKDYMAYRPNIPEDMMEELVSGIPRISGNSSLEEDCLKAFFC